MRNITRTVVESRPELYGIVENPHCYMGVNQRYGLCQGLERCDAAIELWLCLTSNQAGAAKYTTSSVPRFRCQFGPTLAPRYKA